MANHGFLSSDDVRTTYVRPIVSTGWKQVSYAAVGNLAVFEGCIILGTVPEMEQVSTFIDRNRDLLKPGTESFGAAIKGVQYRWKDRIVPYQIDPALLNPQRVRDAIDHWHAKTPFKFVPRDSAKHNDYVVFSPGDGCASNVGRRGGPQDVILGPGCTAGNCIHEIGHTVGLWHEQSRIDRDDFVEIVSTNIIPTMRFNFDQHIIDGIDLGDYDYGSIMHYPKDAFSATGQDTIKPKKPGAQIGQRQGLSPGDIAAVQNL
jgi:hypothetical protein